MVWNGLTLLCFLVVSAPALAERSGEATFVHPGDGYAVSYPEDWHVDRRVLDLGGPLILSNVPAEKYLHGGLLPPGGADITVSVLSESESEEAALAPLRRDNDVKEGDLDLRGRRVPEITYTFDVGKPYTKVASALRIDGRVFLFQLVYAEEGASPGQFRRTLQSVMQSLRQQGGVK